MFLRFLALALVLMHGVASLCPKPCKVTMLSKWPNNGYRASVSVKAPINYRQGQQLRINMFFSSAPQKVENLNIQGGSINLRKSRLLGKRMTLLFRPDQRIRKGSVVKIEFLVRHSTLTPVLTEVRFWRKPVCSATPCPTGNQTSTSKPMTTIPSKFQKCNKVVKLVGMAPDYVKIRLNLPVETAMKGWKLEIQFTKPLLDINNYPARLIEERNMEYFILQNHAYNRDVDVGKFRIMFLAHFNRSYESPPKIAMLKFGSFVCKVSDALTIPPTTAAPPSTRPKPTTKPITTSEPEVVTSNQPITTSEPEVVTSNQPITTSEPEVVTSNQPITTSKPEVVTSNQPITTSEPAVVTSNQPITTSEPEVVTSNQPITTSEPEVVTSNQPITTEEPEVTTPEPEVTTGKPAEVTTKQPASPPAPKKSTTAKPDVTTKKSEVTTKKADLTTPSPSCTPEFDYGQVLNLSLLFYEAQRSGKLPASNRIPYRRDSALNDGQDVGKDLSGGYYDAGDFVKFNFPMAYTITVLSWGVIQYEDAYKSTGQYQNVLDAIKWGTDYFIKCHTAKNELYGQVGDGNADHAYWGRADEMTMNRPSFKIDATKPGSDLAGETAAALAAASLVFKASNPSYSQTLLVHAKELYEFADTFRGKYSDSIPNAANFYRSWSGFNDELTWAAAWLYRASKEAKYLTAAKSFYTQFGMNSNPQEFSWDDKKAGVQVLMSQITGENVYKSNVETFCNSITMKRKTPGGLVFIQQWGPNRHAANVAFICLLAADLGIKQAAYRSFARSQIYYMLGKPKSQRSFLIGFGKNPPQRPHHRSSSCPNRPASCSWNDFNSPAPNPQILYGALVGGPDANDGYDDKRSDYVKNEVACDYNAGFQSAIAALRHLQNIGQC